MVLLEGVIREETPSCWICLCDPFGSRLLGISVTFLLELLFYTDAHKWHLGQAESWNQNQEKGGQLGVPSVGCGVLNHLLLARWPDLGFHRVWGGEHGVHSYFSVGYFTWSSISSSGTSDYNRSGQGSGTKDPGPYWMQHATQHILLLYPSNKQHPLQTGA